MRTFLFFIFITSVVFSRAPYIPEKVSVQECYGRVRRAIEEKDWKRSVYCSQFILRNFPQSSFFEDIFFYLGVSYFNLDDLHFANEYFSRYLKQKISPKFFDEALNFKFLIAEKYRKGDKKHLFGIKKMPKLAKARKDALRIYDEIIASLFSEELTARALFCKGKLLSKLKEYDNSIETFQNVIRRFEKHELAIKSYLAIAKAYLKKVDPKQQDPDLLYLAESNVFHFKEAFPLEERIKEAEAFLHDLKDIYASGLYEIGSFYERTKKKRAACLYYRRILDKFSDTKTAQKSKKRLKNLEKVK